jgi:hypothetical protein
MGIILCGEPREELHKINLRSTVKHIGGSMMVWRCLASGMGNLNLIEGNKNKHFYVNILREHLKANAGNLGILPCQWPKTFFTFGKKVVLVQLPKSN